MFLILPFSKEKISEHVYFICRYWGKILYLLMGVRHSEIFEAPHDFNRAHIFVGNHNSYMDIPSIVQLKHQPIRPLAKFESSKIPLFGLIYRNAVVMVDRSDPEKRAQSLRNLKMALEKHISIFIFPEVDSVDRMHFSSALTLTPGKHRVVYLETVEVSGYTLDQMDDLKDLVFKKMDEGMRRYRKYPNS
jgi:1-acyl-sn-glycerol-3-phosphate acyltransferase